MTSIAPTSAGGHIGKSFVREVFRREARFAGAAVCLAILTLPTLAAMALDPRTLLGTDLWVKPLKFEISLSIYLLTLAWFAGWLPDGITDRLWYRAFSVIVVGCVAAEMIWIGGAAAAGVRSHFNLETRFMAAIYPVMGVLAVVITSTCLVYAALIGFDRSNLLEPVFRRSVGIGLVMTFVLTVVVASYMASSLSHSVAGTMSGAGTLPLVGWSREGGDLRAAHFFATHAMQFVPAFGFIASRTLPPRLGHVSVLGFSLAFAGFVAYTFVEALSGRPFLSTLM